MSTIPIDSLQEIKARIQTQQAEVAASINEARRELEQEQQKLTQLQAALAGQRHDLRTWQTLHRERTMNVKLATHDLEHVKSTSFEESRRERLAAAESALEKSTSELAQLTTALEKDGSAEAALQEQIAALVQRLEQLSLKASDLAATYTRFDLEDQQVRMQHHREALHACDAEISDREAKVLDARQYRAKVFDQGARDVQQWAGDQAVIDFLAEFITIEDTALPDVVAVLAQLAEAKEAVATAERQRAQTGADIEPTIQGRRQEVNFLLARVEAFRKQARESAASALLRELRQPALVPADLALAQQLHAQAQGAVVVEEAKPAPGPARQRYAPQRGIRAFAPAGAVPTVAPSLLNPTVKE